MEQARAEPDMKPAAASLTEHPQTQQPDAADASIARNAGKAQAPEPPAPAVAEARVSIRLEDFGPQHWLGVYQALNVRGVLQSTASNCVLLERQGTDLVFALDQDKGSLYDESHPRRLADLLRDYFAAPVQVSIRIQPLPAGVETPAAWGERQRREAREAAIQRLRDDPLVQQLQKEFDATLDLESVTY